MPSTQDCFCSGYYKACSGKPFTTSGQETRRSILTTLEPWHRHALSECFYSSYHYNMCSGKLKYIISIAADITSRRRLRSSTSSELVVPLSRLVTVGDRSFAVAGPRLWNTLPEDITSAQSLLVFRRKLKFQQSYLDIIL